MTSYPYPYPRVPTGVDYVDPITYEEIPVDDAWYIETNVPRDNRIKHLYQKSTLKQLMGTSGLGKSPFTREFFQARDMKKAPLPGKIHPNLVGKRLQTVLRSPDTKDQVPFRICEGQRVDFTIREPGNTLTIAKLPRSGSSRRWRVNMNLSLEVIGKPDMDTIMDNIAQVLETSSTRLHVDSSRIVRVPQRR